MSSLSDWLERIFAVLDREEAMPDPGRTDWGWAGLPLVAQAREKLEREVWPRLEGATDEERAAGADVTAMVGAAVWAAGDKRAGEALFAKAATIAGPGPAREGFEAAGRDPRAFVMLAHAMWLERHGRTLEGQALRQRLLERTREPALKKAAFPEGPPPGRIVVPRPPRSPRERWAVPLLAAFAAIVTVLLWTEWDARPGERVRRAHAEAKALEQGGQTEEAARRYEGLLVEYEKKVDPRVLEPVAQDLVRLWAAKLPESLQAPGAIRALADVAERVRKLPAAAQSPSLAQPLLTRALAWSSIPEGSPPELVDLAVQALAAVRDLPGAGTAIAARQSALAWQLARTLEPTNPPRAFELLASIDDDPEAHARATTLIKTFDRETLRALRPAVLSWLRRAEAPAGRTPETQAIRDQL